MKNKNLKHIIWFIIASGIIEIVGLILIIVLSSNQQRHYKDIINIEYQLSEDCYNILQVAYYSEKVISSSLVDYNTQEDYAYELRQALLQGNNRMASISKILEESKIELSAENLERKYEKFESLINQVAERISVNHNVMGIYKELEISVQKLSDECSVFQMYLETEKNEQYKKAIETQNMQTILYMVIFLIAVLSTIICTYMAKKNGSEMADIQEHAEKLAYSSSKKAYSDQLTGLWNRAYITKAVTKFIEASITGCLFEMDMDNFKQVNDVYGHIAGDNVLIAFARAMKDSTREGDICCRAGGDEYMLFCKNVTAEQAHIVANKVMAKAHQYLIQVEGGEAVTLSMGGCLITSDIEDFETLYNRADEALYNIKEGGKDGFQLYNSTIP